MSSACYITALLCLGSLPPDAQRGSQSQVERGRVTYTLVFEVVTGVVRWSRPPGSDLRAVPNAWAIVEQGARYGDRRFVDEVSLRIRTFLGRPSQARRSCSPLRWTWWQGLIPAWPTRFSESCATSAAHLKLIASENFAWPAVLLAMGNWLSDKYAEGAPGHRFYAGCDNVDAIETRAAELAQRAVRRRPRLRAAAQRHRRQPGRVLDRAHRSASSHPRSSARRQGRRTICPPSDWETLRRALGNQKMMGMALDAGGHLTHGFRPNVSGKLFRYCSATASTPTTFLLDYDRRARSARTKSGR